MSIEILTSAPDKDLTTLSTVKDEIGITGTDDDNFISRLIQEISAAIVSYTGREFAREEVKEKVGGYGNQQLIVSRTPIKSISEINYDEETTIDTDDYFIGDSDAGFIHRIDYYWESTEPVHVNVSPFVTPMQAEPKWVVTYTGGYVLPSSNWTDTRDLPYDVERACIEGVKARFLARQRDPNITRLNVQQNMYAASFELHGLPPSSIQFLAPYVRVK